MHVMYFSFVIEMVLLGSRDSFISNRNNTPDRHKRRILIVGGGPNGIYAALLLLQADPGAEVHVVDCRISSRPQVIRLPFSVINIVPEEIKLRLWPDKRIRDGIFKSKSRKNPGFWPRCDYKYFPFIQIGEFTSVINNYLKDNFPKSYKYTLFKTFDVEDFRQSVKHFDLSIITAGNGTFNKTLRSEMKIDQMTTDDTVRGDIEQHGVYLLFQTPKKELYERSGSHLRGANVAPLGLTYAHSNDSQNHLQIYTYPVGNFREVFSKMPKSFKTTAAFRNSKPCVSLAGSDIFSNEERVWFSTYRTAIKNNLDSLQIPHPSDYEISVYYANRSEYFYDVAASELEGTPVLFIGDSSGGTDYKFGLSLGRGLITTMNLVQEMKKQDDSAFDGIVDFVNIYWKKVIASEFGKNDPNLSKSPEIVFKYVMEGRMVDDELLNKKSFVAELKTSEASDVKYSPIADFK